MNNSQEQLPAELAVTLETDARGPVIYSQSEELRRDWKRVYGYRRDRLPVPRAIVVISLILAPVVLLSTVVISLVTDDPFYAIYGIFGLIFFLSNAFIVHEAIYDSSTIQGYTDRMAAERSRLLREWREASGQTEPLTEGQLNALQDTLGEDRMAAEQRAGSAS